MNLPSIFSYFFGKSNQPKNNSMQENISEKEANQKSKRPKKEGKIYKIDQVKSHLIEHGSITTWEAITLYGASRLSAYIHTLKNEHSMNIVSERQSGLDRNGNNCPFVVYKLLA